MLIEVRDGFELRSVRAEDAEPVSELIAADRERLARFMPWAAGHTLDQARRFVRDAIEQEERGDGFQAVLVSDGRISGIAGYHAIDRGNATTSIGYWLGSEFQGRRLMTDAVAALTGHAFTALGVHRIELRIAPDNDRSLALAARLGYRREGLLREAERFGPDDHRDLIMHSLLAGEWSRGA